MSVLLESTRPATIPERVNERIPTLDGWRAIAILMVLVDHLQIRFFGAPISRWTQTGQHGVTIFFVLSGFLITSKLLEGNRSLRSFYMRRFFRLMPVAWIYLAALLLLGRLMRVPLTSLSEVRACVLFFRNLSGPFIGNRAQHFWSLSLEEQFYLLWPCLLLLCGKRIAPMKWTALCGALGVAVWRYFHWAAYDQYPLYMRTEVRADSIFIGCLLAIFFSDADFREMASKTLKWLAIPALLVFLSCITRFFRLTPLYESIAIAILIAFTVLHARVSEVLEYKPLAWLGTLSYSLYIWQEIWTKPGFPRSFLLMIPVSALVSYYCIERPMIHLGRTLERSMDESSSGE